MSNEFIVIPPEDRNLKIIDYNDYNAVHNAGETDESLFNGMLTILETTSLNSFLLELIFSSDHERSTPCFAKATRRQLFND